MKKQTNNSRRAKCLREKHSALTAGDGEDVAARLTNPLHEKSANCPCDACDEDRGRHCDNPNACAVSADERLKQLLPEWDPRPEDTPQVNPAGDPGNAELGEGTEFHAPEEIKSLAQGLHVLTRRKGEVVERPRPAPRRRTRRERPIEEQPDEITVYIGTAVETAPKRAPRAAASIFYSHEDGRNKTFRLPTEWLQTSYVAEFAAVLEAIRHTDTGTKLTLVSTQEYVCKAMNVKLARWEGEGWVGVPHREVMQCLSAELKARKAATIFVVAAPGSVAREICRGATLAAKLEACSTRTTRIRLDAPAGTALPGIQLQNNRQRTFYKGIREERSNSLVPRVSTKRNLDAVRGLMREQYKKFITDSDIWESLRNKDLQPHAAQFLWRAMHNAHRVGNYWTHIPECRGRATCQSCGITKDLEHILVKCDSPGQRLIWEAAARLWREKSDTPWPEVSLAAILGCGLLGFDDEDAKKRRSTQRLYRILMSESAYLVWLIRNDRVITRAGEPLLETVILNRWIFTLNQRLQQDITLANRKAGGKSPRLVPSLVKETWAGLLDDEDKLPPNWLRGTRVLVGSRALTPAQLRQRNNDGVG
ncbi:hypothetical protein C8R45DRAFT_817358 [Mycena sanguinolenta]|nr:hypothetical protein C8R45DRAFT_817358 [Mycena sanguinolenta]